MPDDAPREPAPLVVVATDATLRHLADDLARALPAGVELRWADDGDPTALHAALADADMLVAGRFTADMAAAAPRLRLLQVPGAGTDGVDVAALGDARLANAYGHEAAMAEYALWAAIGLRRGLLDADQALRQGRWATPAVDPDMPLAPSLGDARVGFLGFGHIGARCWEALRGFGCRGAAVTGRNRVDAGRAGLDWAGGPDTLTRLCEESDVLVVSVPLTEATRGVVAAAELDALGPRGVLIQLARGPVVDEAALFEALSGGTLGAAAVDVWYSYPQDSPVAAPSRYPFAELPNVLMTPHISGVALATYRARIDDIAANARALLTGDALRHEIGHD